MKKFLINNNILNEINIEFANFICELQKTNADDNDELWLLVAMLSYSANTGDSAFRLSNSVGKPIADFFNINFNLLTESGKEKISKQKVPEFNIDNLLRNTDVIGNAGEMKPIVYENELFFLNKFYNYEKIIAEFIKKKINRSLIIEDNIKEEINKLFPENFINEDVNWQKVAAILALTNDFLVISGGPGTGKTTTAGSILALLLMQNSDLKIKMVAPTGKAADRLNESINKFKTENRAEIEGKIINAIPENAQTIHRFLGINSYKSTIDKYNKAPIDLLLIDEASMVSLQLFAKTFEVLDDKCKVILLGDKDQLMAVENGNVLNDITSVEELNKFSKEFVEITKNITDNQLILSIADNTNNPMQNIAVQLEHSWRFDSKSGIGKLSKIVNETDSGTETEVMLSVFDNFENIGIEHITDEKGIKNYIKGICDNQLKDYVEAVKNKNISDIFNNLSQFKILCAINNGPFGVKEINKVIEKELFPTTVSKLFYDGRAMMITKNDYSLNLFNGDIGVIMKDEFDGEFKAYFRGEGSEEFITYNPSALDEYTTAFAISIHKSQGSEFDKVFIILPDKANRVLTKELLYTGITRAKKECVIIANENIFTTAVRTKMIRQSGLKIKLIK